jgi:hypothetical protein
MKNDNITRQMKRKPIEIFTEKIKFNVIEIGFYNKSGVYFFHLKTLIAGGGIVYPCMDAYRSLREAKTAALRLILQRHKSPKQIELLKKFQVLENLKQPNLFEG